MTPYSINECEYEMNWQKKKKTGGRINRVVIQVLSIFQT